MATILDQYGRVIEAAPKPELGRVVATLAQALTYPSRGLTPGALTAILQEADEGQVARQCELATEMEEKDAHLASVLQTRRMSVLGLSWDVQACPTDAKDAAASQKAEAAQALCQQAMDALDVEDLVVDLMDAIWKGYSIAEIDWRTGDVVMPATVEWVEPSRFVWLGKTVHLLTEASPKEGEPLPANKFLIHTHKARSGWPARAGMFRTCAWLYLFKNYSMKDWLQYCETYGLPLRLGKYPAGATKEDRESLLQALVGIASNAAGIIPDSADIQFIDAGAGKSTGGADVFEKMAAFCERGISKAILGQTLTTDTSGGTGTFAAGSVHNDVRHDLVEADATALAKTIRRDLFRPLVGWNLGWDVADKVLPYLVFDTAMPEDLKSKAETYGVLVEKVGLRIPASHVREIFGVPAPIDNEELVGKVVAPANPASPMPMKAARPGGAQPNKALPVSADPGQAKVDGLVDTVIGEGAPVVAAMVDPLIALVESATDYDDLRDKILAAYSSLGTSALIDVLARAMTMADLGGRANA
jgi:phage gp29-like protein